MKQRVLTAALLIPLVLAAVFSWHIWPLWLAVLAAFLAGYVELRKLAGSTWRIPLLGMIPILLTAPAISSPGARDLPLVSFSPSMFPVALWFTLAAAVGVIGCAFITQGGRGVFAAELASLWLAAPLASLVVLKLHEDVGSFFVWTTPLLFAFIPLWLGDTAAYFVGKAFGKHLLAPRISPKKTWEGAIANFAGCMAGALLVARITDVPTYTAILVGLATGVLGQAGDLLESSMKRSAGVKDSGKALPGHGGLLDRIDSLLLTAPFVSFIVAAFVVPPR